MRVGKAMGMKESILVYSEDKKWVLPTQKVGVEIELENVRMTRIPAEITQYWETHGDDSLRNNGVEFTTRGGLFGKDLTAAIHTFCSNVHREWQVSHRTGLHIHVDVTDMETFPELANFCLLYALFEKLLFAWAGDDRENNINCLPWYKAQGDLPLIATLISPSTKATEFRHAVSDIHRYSGLNLASLGKFGTVECRHLKSTVDETRICTWINFWLAMKKMAMSLKSKSFVETLLHVEADPAAFFNKTFGRLAKEFSECGDPHYQMMNCMTTAYDLALLYQDETDNKPTQAQDWDDVQITTGDIDDTPLMKYIRKHNQ